MTALISYNCYESIKDTGWDFLVLLFLTGYIKNLHELHEREMVAIEPMRQWVYFHIVTTGGQSNILKEGKSRNQNTWILEFTHKCTFHSIKCKLLFCAGILLTGRRYSQGTYTIRCRLWVKDVPPCTSSADRRVLCFNVFLTPWKSAMIFLLPWM